MPERIHAIAAEVQGSNRLSGVTPVLAQLLYQDAKIKTAFLCRDNVEHYYKAKGEGDHFCGYRNIQMLLSSLHGDGGDADQLAKRHDYSIIQLQNMIEEAWSAGINSNGMTETGGIKDTRKHIGTSEVCELIVW